MTTVTPYRCWSSTTASSTISTEAVSPSASVFLATHAPLRIRRSRLKDGTRDAAKSLDQGDETLDEHAVLRDFLTRKSDTGALLLPVVGDSGSGKSHLVRWVRENIEETARRKVIYLRKDETSLRAVIGKLLADLDTPRAEELRASIDKLTTDVGEATLALRLIHGLDEELSATTSEGVSGRKRVLRGQKGLAVVLQDPHVRQYMLAPHRFIPQLARRLLANRQAGDNDRPERFDVTDLPLNFADAASAAVMTKKILVFLDDPELQQAAVELLNAHLEAAVRKAYNLSAGSLFQAMQEVRAEYAARRQEIILLIEDFALIQGIQGDLLEAAIETAYREGRQVGAEIRTLMAVTTGYFQDLPETALTRVHAAFGHVYDLDGSFTAANQGEEYIASFAGRYLNAARVGSEKLSAVPDGAPIPNVCSDCPVQKKCHAAFGVSAEGYGLFPFNRSALRRMVHSVAPRKDPYRFVPRAMLGGVLKQIMVDHYQAIMNHEFPDAAFRVDFPLADNEHAPSTALLGSIMDQFPDSAEFLRQRLFVEFWGDATATYPGTQEMRRAFNLAELRDSDNEQNPVENSRKSAAQTTSNLQKSDVRKPEKSFQARLDNIEFWATRNDEMAQDTANRVREVLTDAIASRYTWLDPLMAQKNQDEVAKFWRNTSSVVYIDQARASGLKANREAAHLSFSPTPANSKFFQAILLAKNGHEMSSYDEYYRLAEIAERKASAFTTTLQTSLRVSDADLVLGLRAALIGAALAGKAWPGMAEDALLNAALHDGRGWVRTDAARRHQNWMASLDRHLANRAALVRTIRDAVGVTKGNRGEVLMIDAARLLPLLADAAAVWEWKPNDPPVWVTPAVHGFANLPDVVKAQFANIGDTVLTARNRLGDGVPIQNVVRAVLDVMTQSAELGVPVSSSEKMDLTQKAAQLGEVSTSLISELEAGVVRVTSASDAYVATLQVTAPDRGTVLWDVNDFLAASDEWLTRANSAARLQLGEASPDLRVDVRAVVQEWSDLVTEGGANE